MTGNLKTAFDGIRAEDTLKNNTILYLQREIESRSKAQNRAVFGRYAVALASIVVVILSGLFSYNLYFTPSTYVDLDINPSVGLILNRFDRVIDVHAYNEDGEQILTGLSLRHKRYNDALLTLIDTIDQNGYIQNDGLVSVTIQTDGNGTNLLDNIQTDVESYINGHHHGTQIDVFSVSSNTRSQAYEQGVTPAKYLAIQELIVVDPTVTVESCRGHSISEIKQQTREHGNHHDNGKANNSDEAADNDTPDGANDYPVPKDEDIQDVTHGNGHHGKNNSGGRHGNGHD